MKNRISSILKITLLFFTAITLCKTNYVVAQSHNSVPDVLVNGNDIGRTFYGAGAISAGANARLLYDYPEPERSQILDYIFKPGYGAALQILKVEMGGDSNTTVGADPTHMRAPNQVDCNRGYQWWLMKEARKRNPNIKLAAQEWSAPGWIDSVWSKKNIDYHLAWLKCAEQHGLKINYIGGWNEKGFNTDWFIDLDKALKAHYPDIKVPAADEIRTWRVADSMATDPRFDQAVDMVAVHWPCGWRTHYRKCPSPKTAQALDKPLQMTNAAMGHNVGAGPHARALNRMYINGKMTSYLVWNTVETWYANLPIGDSGIMQARWPWSGYYELGKNIWAFAHTTQFTEPGWHYLDSGSKRLDDKATIVSLADSTSQKYSMIIETMDMTRPDTVSVQLKNLPARVLHKWETNIASNDPSDYFRNVGTIVPYKGRFQLILHPNHIYSITSTTGQGKGYVHSNASEHRQLGLPFNEDFENTPQGRMAPLFTTLNGAFEVTPCKAGRPGKCYQQMVKRSPIIWNNLGNFPPTTMVGDPRWWGDYTISADVLLKQPGYVRLVGRIAGQRPWTSWLDGLYFQIGTDGWKLYSEDSSTENKTTLAKGETTIDTGKWHKVGLRMKGDEIAMLLDGKILKKIRDTHQRTGNVAFQTNKWNNAQFDNISVTQTGPSPQFISDDSVKIAGWSSEQDFYKGWTFEAANAIDDRPETRWQTENGPRPHSITLDLGRNRMIQGLYLKPRFDKTNAMITGYKISVSGDGRSFHTIAQGNWPATSSAKLATWSDKVSARFVRLIVTDSVNNQASATEIRIIRQLPSVLK